MLDSIELERQDLPQHQIPRRPVSSLHSSSTSLNKDNPPVYSSVAQQEQEHERAPQASRRALWFRSSARPAWIGTFQWPLSISSHYLAWMPEILSLMSALLLLLAIVILLRTRQDRPLPKWPSALQVNSLISIFSSLFKVAMLFPIAEGISELKWVWFGAPKPVSDFDRFDAATRGPWGSFKLLVKRPLNLLTSFGAVIIIFALAIDPFTQQVVQFYSCTREVPGLNATIPRAGNYTLANPTEDGIYYADTKMLGAIYQGLLRPSSNATTEISPYCPLGNCTFPHTNGVAYSSLAICSEITDISSAVTSDYNTTFFGEMSLPSGLTIRGNDSQALATATIDYTNSTMLDTGPPLFTMQILSIKATKCDFYEGEKLCLFIPFAVNVTLTPCVHQYGNVSVSGTIFERTTMPANSSGVLMGIPTLGYGLFGEISSPPGSNCSFSEKPTENKTIGTAVMCVSKQNSPEDEDAGVIVMGDAEDCVTVRCAGTACVGLGSDTRYYDPACAFSLAREPSQGLFNSFKSLFGSIDEPKVLTLNTSNLAGPVSADAWVEVFWKDGDQDVKSVTNVTDGLLYSVNAVIVDDGSPSNSAPASGTVLGVETCVGVVWGWLALPIVLLALSVAFLTFTLLASHRSTRIDGAEAGRPPWKSSTSPLLWCGVQDATREKHGTINAVEEMKHSGDETYVSLDRYDGITNASGRWVLREHATASMETKNHLKVPKVSRPSRFQRLSSDSTLNRMGRADRGDLDEHYDGYRI